MRVRLRLRVRIRLRLGVRIRLRFRVGACAWIRAECYLAKLDPLR